VVQCLPSMREALGSIPAPKKRRPLLNLQMRTMCIYPIQHDVLKYTYIVEWLTQANLHMNDIT
jgi:hypothetical protein